MTKLLAVFAHPDDESFGPGGTLAQLAKKGIEVHLLCCTHGEAGQNGNKEQPVPVAKIREHELRSAGAILGISNIHFLNYLDGEIANHEMGYLTADITHHVNTVKPDILLTMDIAGHYGHLDHMAVAAATTFAYLKSPSVKKLYYHVLPQLFAKVMNKDGDRPFFFTDNRLVTTVIDIKSVWDTKVAAVKAHATQRKDWQTFLPIFEKLPKKEYFVLTKHRLKNVKFPEIDLLGGLRYNKGK